MSPRKKRQNWMAKSDVIFSKLIRARDGRCLNCGTDQSLQCAHIIRRTYKSVRTLDTNAIALCASCHVYFTYRDLEWQDFIEEMFPGRWDELRRRALRYDRVVWKDELERLRALAVEVGV